MENKKFRCFNCNDNKCLEAWAYTGFPLEGCSLKNIRCRFLYNIKYYKSILHYERDIYSVLVYTLYQLVLL